MQFNSLVNPTNSKVAIPRIARAQSGNAARRAKRACLGCRQKKAKCDGRQPCHQCVLFDAVCEYAEGNEDRIKRRVLELEGQIDVYDQLLRRLRFKVDVHDREVIDRVLIQPFLVPGHARYLGAGKTDGRRAGGQFRNNRRANPSGRINVNMERSIGKNQV
ncbi:C6 transcription factor, putative [Aspergillus fumigatus A1163]|uniref:C6 transcription factor, putative n=1 Tax=Aspergillus fumigatus (strain CBS 144.89 / FGSC A1163 / CEA10) TaxID=451804 RepID=B0Y901_ASPFC|nr:C6 transcription factor, putative [Aspergillus fumigatus A1163]